VFFPELIDFLPDSGNLSFKLFGVFHQLELDVTLHLVNTSLAFIKRVADLLNCLIS
jgi:hypothetical protein